MTWKTFGTTRAQLARSQRELTAALQERDLALSGAAATLSQLVEAQRSLKLTEARLDLLNQNLVELKGQLRASELRASDEVNRLSEQMESIARRQRGADRHMRFMPRELLTDIQALIQLIGRYEPEARLPAVAGWALSPAGLLALAELIITCDARTVVECGSGTSTIWMGYALKRLGRGRLIALDHLPEYADKTRRSVAAHGLQDFVDVRIAPLAALTTVRGEFSWYSLDALQDIESIEVLLVDGPPGATGPHARYPALGAVVEKLAQGAMIVVDDVDRTDEQEMVNYWLAEEPGLSRVESPGHGIEVLQFQGPVIPTPASSPISVTGMPIEHQDSGRGA